MNKFIFVDNARVNKKNYSDKKIPIFAIVEIICGFYTIFWSSWDGLYWLRLGGIILVLIGVALFKLKKWVRILNIIFSIVFLVLYFFLFFHLLIVQGYIQNVNNPFFLIGLTVHLPVILFNIFAIVFLLKEKETKKGVRPQH